MQALKSDGWKDTALHYAAARGSLDCCKVLLAFGAQLHAKNYAGRYCNYSGFIVGGQSGNAAPVLQLGQPVRRSFSPLSP